MRRLRDDHGQVTVLVLGMALVVFGVSGLAADGTRAFLFRRSLQNTADAAALAGASEIDHAAYYATGGRRVTLDRSAAGVVARRWLARRSLGATGYVEVSARSVHVVLRGRVPTLFLRVVGVDDLPVAVEATSSPISGR